VFFSFARCSGQQIQLCRELIAANRNARGSLQVEIAKALQPACQMNTAPIHGWPKLSESTAEFAVFQGALRISLPVSFGQIIMIAI